MCYRDDDTPRLIVSYLTLRRALGIFGILLPALVVFGALVLDSSRLLSSVSAYYGTSMRDVLVGFEFAMGWFLFSYRGYDRRDDIIGDLACVFFLGTAVFPTTSANETIQIVHAVCAAGAFLMLATFSLCLFTKTRKDREPTDEKKDRNKIYVGCGVIMLVCIALVAVNHFFFKDSGLSRFQPVFWLETIAMLAFGVSWITKGEWLRKDAAGPNNAE